MIAARYLIVFVLFAIAIISLDISKHGAYAKPNNQIDKVWKKKKSVCERSSECVEKIPDESQNCVNKCTSKACYDAVYAAEPLEDGEIDTERMSKFTNCLRREEKDKKKNQFQAAS